MHRVEVMLLRLRSLGDTGALHWDAIVGGAPVSSGPRGGRHGSGWQMFLCSLLSYLEVGETGRLRPECDCARLLLVFLSDCCFVCE